MATQAMVEATERAIRDHFAFPPNTWNVVKVQDRVWTIAPPFGEPGAGYDRFTTKREATHALLHHKSWGERIYWGRDAWYRETSNDPRNRPLEDWEREIVARYATEEG